MRLEDYRKLSIPTPNPQTRQYEYEREIEREREWASASQLSSSSNQGLATEKWAVSLTNLPFKGHCGLLLRCQSKLQRFLEEIWGKTGKQIYIFINDKGVYYYIVFIYMLNTIALMYLNFSFASLSDVSYRLSPVGPASPTVWWIFAFILFITLNIHNNFMNIYIHKYYPHLSEDASKAL